MIASAADGQCNVHCPCQPHVCSTLTCQDIYDFCIYTVPVKMSHLFFCHYFNDMSTNFQIFLANTTHLQQVAIVISPSNRVC